MNYVNKENAIALKELGFDVPVAGNFQGYILLFTGIPTNHNTDLYSVSAPDFLTAADWLSDITNNKIEICFNKDSCTAFFGLDGVYDGEDRNAAITYAIQQIKNYQSNETQS